MDVPLRLWADVSLWSADLARLAEEVRRIDAFADSYHLDASDGTLAPVLLFFPDLVRAIRPLTRRPLHIHLMAQQSQRWIEPFAKAGADWITVHQEAADANSALRKIRAAGLRAGVALQLSTPCEAVLDSLPEAELVLLLGTAIGEKGQSLDPGACGRLREMRGLLEREGLAQRIALEADGAIRRDTVARLCDAGANLLVPGSLAFSSGDLAEMFDWLRRFRPRGRRIKLPRTRPRGRQP